MVLDYAKSGSLRHYLVTNDKLSLTDKINYLYGIASGLADIHKNGLIHRDLHSGNILIFHLARIADMGLCKPTDCNIAGNTKNSVYGILPYIAPEILQEHNYTDIADIYSLGIIMYEFISGLPPYYNLSHDEYLAMKICQGLRPRFNDIKVPQLIVRLIKRCLDASPLKRPTAKEIKEILYKWNIEAKYHNTELYKQIKEANEFNNNLQTNDIPSTGLKLSYKTHSGAVYTSRLLNFYNLPKSKNCDDYYDEQNDDIISMKSSVSLQIDIPRLKINDNNLHEPKNSNIHYDDIISTEFPESLQIDISRPNLPETKNSDDHYKHINNLESSASISLQIDISQLNIDEDDQNSKNKDQNIL
ncbi:kinase-like domain-containing protein [Rhizophagus irregularis DAOM 181602=DAOM 197198]|uniref:Kinase-like domain-containing protein n=1 Tax=Rhizophagus irregularis (strain DAOM 181602 / DAOM 197198 / MUCL 43194) TaxID=747089 RepID=A0A2P4QBG7_RHIID|nr:kinase-like domain-containing protein [Rhizophagus irregularis DAOM 181602=DAOM 197198]POG74982.1 kinase-like domain-containing protein [Rhizophagus irregularis DAOM 181602=DAOM 197198]|eukprot:XP_025181848.1 kinase-like domain-containing protein [Rhizophagus irregularis DAOM 181602=DAOM 197198]